jgi:hypothetical protein
MITPDIEAPHVRDFSARLCDSPIYYIPVNPPIGAEENWCERNVLEVVRKFGGEAVYGWHVSEWPGIYISGRHHVVWRSPDGQMIDATPHGMGFHHVAFIDDARVADEFCKVPSVDHCLVADEDVAEWLEMGRIGSEQIARTDSLDSQLQSQLQSLLSRLEARYGPEPRGGPSPELLYPRAEGFRLALSQ